MRVFQKPFDEIALLKMRRLKLGLVGLVSSVVAPANVFSGVVAGLVAPGLPAMEKPELLPFFPPNGTETRQSSSYDPSGSNNDGSSNGFILLRYFYGRDCQAWPDYLCAVDYGIFTNRQLSLWKNATASTLLTSPISYCARYLGALETSSSNCFTLYVNDTQLHQLALYACDYDRAGREETLEVRDLKDQLLTPPIDVRNFEQGKWLQFKFSGSIRISVSNQKSVPSAVLSAIMFDKAP